MRTIFLSGKADLAWLFSTHMKEATLEVQARTQSFVLYGNEDCPSKIELYDKRNPLYDELPFITKEF